MSGPIHASKFALVFFRRIGMILSGTFGSCAGSLVQNVGVPSNLFGRGSYFTSNLFADAILITLDKSRIAKITATSFFNGIVWRWFLKKLA